MTHAFLALSSLALVFNVQAAGFDCSKASTTLEKTICGDPKLDAADAELTKVYVEVRKNLPQKAARQALKQDQRAWLKKRTEDCKASDAFCLFKLYEVRIETLQAMQQSSAEESWNFSAKLHNDLPQIQFKLYGSQQDDRYSITKIEINYGDNTQTIDSYGGQKLETDTIDLQDTGFVIEDVNFDGYKDMRLMEFMPAGPDVPFITWLYDADKKSFAYHRAFSELTSPVFDAEKKQIVMPWREGAMGIGENTYIVENNQLVLLRQEIRQYLEEGGYNLMVKELKEGKWVVVEDKVVKE